METKASTIPEFCKQHRISVAFFYKLKQAGKAPRTTNLGARRIVTDEDAAEWRKAIYDIRPRLIVIDNSADVYAGNENDRAQVRQFITLLRGPTIDVGAGLILTSHPSLTGISTGILATQ